MGVENNNGGGGWALGIVGLGIVGAIAHSAFGGEGNEPTPQQIQVGISDFSCANGQKPDSIRETITKRAGETVQLGTHIRTVTAEGKLEDPAHPDRDKQALTIRDSKAKAVFDASVKGKTVFQVRVGARCE